MTDSHDPALADLQAYFGVDAPFVSATASGSTTAAHAGDHSAFYGVAAEGDAAVILRIMADPFVGAAFAGHANTDPATPGLDKSAIDQSLCNIVHRFTRDPAQIERIVRGTMFSGRTDEKTARADYWRRTIDSAFDRDTEAASPNTGLTFNPWPEPEAIGQASWDTARLTPDCVVESLIYNDVGTWNAAGGSSKTTFLLNMFIHIVLGIRFCGRRISRPGRVVFVTAEDTKEISTARLREMASQLFPFGTTDLPERQSKIDAVRDGVRIIDVSAMPVKLTTIDNTLVRAHEVNVNWLIERIAPLDPVLVVFDPTVSFGIGEGRPNDAEQALIEAARMVVRRLDCAFLYVHHTGKDNARQKREDQYSGRGGSSLADGSRMVFVMNPVDPKDWTAGVGSALEPGEVGLKISIAKLSYAGPQFPLYIVRNGFSFRHVMPLEPSSVDGVFDFIASEWAEKRKHSKSSLEKAAKQLRLPRDKIRSVVDRLIEEGRLKPEKGDGNSQWLEPVSVADAGRETGTGDA